MGGLDLMFRRRPGAFHIRMAGCGGCAQIVDEMLRFGRPARLAECASPRHAELVFVTGCLTADLEPAALTVIAQAPLDRRLVVAGDCAMGKGLPARLPLAAAALTGSLTPDLEISGCPVARESLAEGVRSVIG